MSLNAYDASAGVFVHGLTNLKAQLKKAEEHAAATGSGEAAVLNAKLGSQADPPPPPSDLHHYTLAAHAHWAAEGARLAIARLLGTPRSPAPSNAKSFAELHQHLDAAIADLREVPPSALEAGLARPVVIEHPRGSTSASGRQFLLAFALPHFFFHLSAAYGILRNQGVRLTMGDFLGNWAST